MPALFFFLFAHKKWVPFACMVLGVLSIVACQPKPAGVKPSMIAQLDTNQYTRIQWKDTLLHFGTVREGDTVRLQYSFVNTGDKLLFINEVRPGCGCTIADYSQEPVMPGKSGFINVVFTTDWHPGSQQKIIMVKANTKGKVYHKLIFFGEVIAKPKHT